MQSTWERCLTLDLNPEWHWLWKHIQSGSGSGSESLCKWGYRVQWRLNTNSTSHVPLSSHCLPMHAQHTQTLVFPKHAVLVTLNMAHDAWSIVPQMFVVMITMIQINIPQSPDFWFLLRGTWVHGTLRLESNVWEWLGRSATFFTEDCVKIQAS